MEVKIISWLIAIVISGLLYRCGGMGKEPTARPKWIPIWLRRSWVRDWLCPLFVYGALLLFWLPSFWWQWLMVILCYPLLGGALSTYWDWLFGFDNYWFAGLMCGVTAFPLIFCGFPWWIILIRAILVGVLWGLWCKYQGTDWVEEMGRGAIIILTIPVLVVS